MGNADGEGIVEKESSGPGERSDGSRFVICRGDDELFLKMSNKDNESFPQMRDEDDNELPFKTSFTIFSV